MSILVSVAAFILAIGMLVSFHEYGHYWVARWCGVEVERFSIGLGKPIFTIRSGASSTEWVLGSIPLGGYVKLNEASFESKKLFQRSLIVAAGPFANFLLAVCLLTILYVSGVRQLPSKLGEPPANSVAAMVGIRDGDQVVGFKNTSNQAAQEIISWNQLRWKLLNSILVKDDIGLELKTPEGSIDWVWLQANDYPQLTPESDPIGSLGLKPSLNEPIGWFEYRLEPISAFLLALERTQEMTIASVRMLLGIFEGQTSIKQIGGPLSIADMAGKSVQVGWQAFLGFLTLMSISLGILNLLPLPMLDGGQLMYDAWELVTGKRISLDWRMQFQRIGVICLMLLTFLAIFNDFSRIFIR